MYLSGQCLADQETRGSMAAEFVELAQDLDSAAAEKAVAVDGVHAEMGHLQSGVSSAQEKLAAVVAAEQNAVGYSRGGDHQIGFLESLRCKLHKGSIRGHPAQHLSRAGEEVLIPSRRRAFLSSENLRWNALGGIIG